MIVEIEYYKNDCYLYKKKESFSDFKEQIKTVEKLYDRQEDNFIALLCRLYGYNILTEELNPDYVYDRDTGIFFDKLNMRK